MNVCYTIRIKEAYQRKEENMEILDNFPLWAAFMAIIIAQAIKIPLAFFATKNLIFHCSQAQVGCLALIQRLLPPCLLP